MDHKQKSALAVAVAAGLGGMAVTDDAQALTYSATLTSLLVYSNNGTGGSPSNISSSTATFSYDDVTGLISQTGGTVNQRVTTAPTTTLYRAFITGLSMGNGGAASASSYSCVEGNFGATVGASICGNYLLGANYASDSTTTWGPGTAVSRTIGGDDIAAGPVQSIAGLNSMATVSWVGTSLVLRNATCNSTICNGTTSFNNGQQWTFNAGPQVVPIPATAWLLGTGLMGLAGRRYLRKKA